MSVDFLERFLPTLYHTAEQPESWNHALDQIRDELQVGSAVVQMLTRRGNRLAQQWVVRDSLSAAHAESHDCLVNNDQNPRLEISGTQELVADYSIVRDEDQTVYRQPQFRAFRDRLKTLGYGRAVTLEVRYPEDRHLCLVLHRNYSDSRDFNHEQEKLLRLLTPHLKQTVSLCEKLGQFQRQVEVLSLSINHLNSGVVVLDPGGKINWVNDCALQLLARSQLISITGGRLRCSSEVDQAVLIDVLQSAYSDSASDGHFGTRRSALSVRR